MSKQIICQDCGTYKEVPAFEGDGVYSNHICRFELREDYQTKTRGSNDDEYQIYLACADNGKGGDITNNGKPLKTYQEWLNS